MTVRSPAPNRKDGAILVRISVEDRAIIGRRASMCALSVSEFVRRCALGRPLSTRVEIEAITELRRQGGLIKHLASNDRQHAYEYRVALNLIHDAIRRVTRAGESTQKAD